MIVLGDWLQRLRQALLGKGGLANWLLLSGLLSSLFLGQELGLCGQADPALARLAQEQQFTLVLDLDETLVHARPGKHPPTAQSF
jgi:hypothetical protein